MKRYPKTIEAKESEAERAFQTRWIQLNSLRAEDVRSVPVREYRFDTVLASRFDFAWPQVKVAVEIEGGTWMRISGHTSGAGYAKDCFKYNRAAELGWTVLRYTPQMVEADPAFVIHQIENVIRSKSS